MENVEQTIISQYANAPALIQLIQTFNACVDPTANIDAFYANIWDVETAQGVGLDIWGRIVGVQRVLNVASGVYFGFAEAGDYTETGFNQAPFFGGGPTTVNYTLSDEQFRELIYAKAMANITDCSIPSINKIMMTVFGSQGNCHVTDLGGMAMAYTFDFLLSPVDSAIVEQSGVLPRPVGVRVNSYQTGAPPSVSIGAGVMSPPVPNVSISAGVLRAGGVPGAALNAATLTFASTAVGAAAANQTLVVTNTGTAPLVIRAITASGDFSVVGETAP